MTNRFCSAAFNGEHAVMLTGTAVLFILKLVNNFLPGGRNGLVDRLPLQESNIIKKTYSAPDDDRRICDILLRKWITGSSQNLQRRSANSGSVGAVLPTPNRYADWSLFFMFARSR